MSTTGDTDATETTHELCGLEPDNLLAFLALLGVLRSLETVRPDWYPRVSWRGLPPGAVLHLVSPCGQGEIADVLDWGIRRLGEIYVFDKKNITFTAEEFRTCAKRAGGDGGRTRLLAALASDAALKRDGTVEPTPLCVLLGQGHQDFLSRLAATATRDDPNNASDISHALFETWQYEDETESFRWDPIEDRRYALQFGNPSDSKNKIGTVSGANRLAAIGFGALTSVPSASGLVTLGVAGPRRERDVCWPMVELPTGLAGYLALLAHPALGNPKEAPALAAYGVRAVSRARRFQVGKFFNFERARLQYL